MIKIHISSSQEDYHKAAALVAALRDRCQVKRIKTPDPKPGSQYRSIYIEVQ